MAQDQEAEENERKYRFDGELAQVMSEADKRLVIEQHYLAADPGFECRVRKTMKDGEATFSLGIKVGGFEQSRFEISKPITEASFLASAEFSIGSITKSRYDFGNGLTLDVINRPGDTPLVLVELEGAQHEPPSWVGEEVTGLPKFYNSVLSGARTL